MQRSEVFTARFLVWWSVIWAVIIGILAPIVNIFTPFLNPQYNNVWTPDVFWRLLLYWHGGFIPWMTALGALVMVAYGLTQANPNALTSRLLKHGILWGGIVAVPLAAIAGIFDVYDRFLFGVPLWSQILAFLVADEMAIALVLALLVYPKMSGRSYGKIGLPFYVLTLSIISVLVSALMGHMAGWISWFGPSPALFSQYISGQMYPMLGFYNSTAVVTFTEDVVGSHSHLMLISVMAGIVALTPSVYGYAKWEKKERAVSTIGFVIMIVGLLLSIWIYIVSGVGNYVIPTLFQSGPNGLAMDDLMTGIVALGGAFVLAGLFMYALKGTTRDGTVLVRDPLFLSLVAAWLFIYLVIPITGYYIEFNESFYQTTGIGFDAAFTRYHQDFAFFLLPALVTTILIFEVFGISGKIRRKVGLLYLGGATITLLFGMLYAMVTLDMIFLYVAAFGGVLMGLGALIGAEYVRKTGNAPKPGSVIGT